ncbi:MAG: hypothetical protein J6Y29_00540 [Clostridiales bacterium]|nr:hypothetical protein [Clostridiales bacterium]
MGENIDIRELRKRKRKEKRNKIINAMIFTILLVSIVGLSVLSYIRTRDIDVLEKCKFLEKYVMHIFEKEEKIYFEMEFDLPNKPKVRVYNKNIANCTRKSIDIYDRNGKLQSSTNVDYEMLRVSSNGNYFVVAEAGGNKVILFEGSKKKREIDVGGSIINIDVNKNGYVTVVRKGENVLSEVSVYNPEGKECFVKGKAKNYVVFAKLAKNDRDLIINCLDTTGTKLNSVFEFTDIMGKNVGTMVSHEDMIFADAKFVKDENVVALTNEEIVYYNASHSEEWRKKFDTKIYGVDICNGKYIVVGIADDTKTKVSVFNTKGKVKSTINVDGVVKNISSFDNAIAINLGREVLLYNAKGKYQRKISSKIEVDKIDFIDKDTLVLVTRNGLVVKN